MKSMVGHIDDEGHLGLAAWRAMALRGGASLIALCCVAAAPAVARAQAATGQAVGSDIATDPAQDSGDTTAPEQAKPAPNDTAPPAGASHDIIVTGIRASLANSQSIKRNSDTIVDAITAQDIGALPDRSVTEALQRVPGVAMSRFAAANDPDHFSVEGSGVTVRGLTFVRSEFNGRDTFSAGLNGQAINFSDVPSELLGSVEVYKNTTADMIEGGLAGTVNLNTRMPLDNKGFHISWDTEMNYGDLARQWSPTDSLLISNTWETGAGTFGLLADFSYSDLKSRADGIQITNYQTRDGTSIVTPDTFTAQTCRNALPGDDDTMTLPPSGSPCGTAGTDGPDGLADPASVRYAPLGGQFRTQDFDHKRNGIAIAAQWESLDHRAKLTAQYLRTQSTNNWGEHTFEAAPDLSEYNTYPLGCVQNADGPDGSIRAECPVGQFQNYQYDKNGVFQSGYITLPGSGWRSADTGQPTTRATTGGLQQMLARRQVQDKNLVSDYGLNFKFKPDDHWSINLDGDYTKARHDSLDVTIWGSTFADDELDLTGNLPVVIPHKPATLSPTWAAPNPIVAAQTDQEYFSDRANQYWRAVMDHLEHSSGHEWAFKSDMAYKFNDGGALDQLKFGARIADRRQTIHSTAYNWGFLSDVWSGTGAVFLNQAGGDQASFYNFNNFFRGQTPGPVGAYYYAGDIIKNYDQFSQFATGINHIWTDVNGSTNTDGWVPLADRPGVIAGTPYLPNEIQKVGQKDKEAYVMLSFGNDQPLVGGIRLRGNIGLRYARTDVDSFGYIAAPTQSELGISDPFTHFNPVTQTYDGHCDPKPPPEGAPAGTPSTQPGGLCLLGAQGYANLQQFSNGAATPNDAQHSYGYWLPSVNLKFGLTRDLIFRLAGSRVLTRPSMADIRNSLQVGYDPITQTITYNVGNPYLKPAVADQFDATLEWYFARVGSLTIDAFYKRIHNFFFTNIINRSFTNNGVTETAAVRGPDNYDGSGKIQGVEVAYQQTFDFLPGALSGLGVNATYTYLESSGLPETFLTGAGQVATGSSVETGRLPLEQLSKHNANFTLFYEKGPISLRAAYSWRSKFLLTDADSIFPYYPIYNAATGQLDASAFYSITNNIKIGVQAVNLTNEVTKTLQQFTTSGLQGPRSYFMNDRRYSFIMRANF
jgi:TonB-dependent receptor